MASRVDGIFARPPGQGHWVPYHLTPCPSTRGLEKRDSEHRVWRFAVSGHEMWQETWKQFEARLHREGRGDELLAAKAECKQRGLSPQDARAALFAKFGRGRYTPPGEEAGKTGAGCGTCRQTDFQRTAECSPREDILWVAAHMEVAEVRPVDAPSSTAWGMLMAFRGSALSKQAFWKDIYSRVIVAKMDFEREERMRDDGRRQIELIEDAEKALGQGDAYTGLDMAEYGVSGVANGGADEEDTR